MAPQHTILLLIISVFFSKGLALECYECIPVSFSGQCTNQINTCQSQCSSITTTIYTDYVKQSHSIKTCGDLYSCPTGSINFGKNKVKLNSQCCNTHLCNSQDAPELPRQPPNGKSCYTCEKSDCSRILFCEGDETQCFTTTVEQGSTKETFKGCASKLFCENYDLRTNASRVLGRNIGYEMKCCESNLCNSAQNMIGFFLPYLVSITMFLLFV